MFKKLLCPFVGLILGLILVDYAQAGQPQCGPAEAMVAHEQNIGGKPTIMAQADPDTFMVIYTSPGKEFHVYFVSRSNKMACLMAKGVNFTILKDGEALPIGG